MKKDKTLEVEGYTIRTLSSGFLFRNHIHEVVEPDYNETTVRFCTKERYQKCRKNQSCKLCEPDCEVGKASFLKLPYGSTITQKREKQIEEKLKKIWKTCKPVRITIKEG